MSGSKASITDIKGILRVTVFLMVCLGLVQC